MDFKGPNGQQYCIFAFAATDNETYDKPEDNKVVETTSRDIEDIFSATDNETDDKLQDDEVGEIPDGNLEDYFEDDTADITDGLEEFLEKIDI